MINERETRTNITRRRRMRIFRQLQCGRKASWLLQGKVQFTWITFSRREIRHRRLTDRRTGGAMTSWSPSWVADTSRYEEEEEDDHNDTTAMWDSLSLPMRTAICYQLNNQHVMKSLSSLTKISLHDVITVMSRNRGKVTQRRRPNKNNLKWRNNLLKWVCQ